MGGTDPFGREQGDDPLAEMGWTSSASTAPSNAEVAAPEQPDRAARRTTGHVPPRAGMPGGFRVRRRRRRGVGCGFVVLALVAIGPVAALVVPAVDDVVDSVEEIDDAIPRVPTVPAVDEEPGGGPRERPARPPRGLSQRSMLRRGNLAPALRRLRRVTGGGRVRLVRIDAQNVIVQVAVSGGRTRLAQATWEGKAEVLSTSPGGAGETFPWSRIDPSAPARIVRAATRGRAASTFDYAVLIDALELQWSAFLKEGRGVFTATLDGRTVNRVGG